jgi:hypothetical protein
VIFSAAGSFVLQASSTVYCGEKVDAKPISVKVL